MGLFRWQDRLEVTTLLNVNLALVLFWGDLRVRILAGLRLETLALIGWSSSTAMLAGLSTQTRIAGQRSWPADQQTLLFGLR